VTRTCIRCGAPAGKGRHSLTTKTPDATARFEFSCCDECGPLLQKATSNALMRWRRREDKQ